MKEEAMGVKSLILLVGVNKYPLHFYKIIREQCKEAILKHGNKHQDKLSKILKVVASGELELGKNGKISVFLCTILINKNFKIKLKKKNTVLKSNILTNILLYNSYRIRNIPTF